MKKKHYLLTAVISYLLFLLVTIPAKPFTELLNDNSPVTVQGVSGTLWNGNARKIMINNIQLDKTKWSLNLWAIIMGGISVDIKTQYANNDISAVIGSSFLGRYFIDDLSAKISAQKLAQLANIPLAQFDGMITIDIEHAQWKQGELPLANGEIKWINATITVAETASLGNVLIVLSESDDQLLNANIKNQGGDIKITGSAELVPDANYNAEIELTPTASANNNIKQSLGLFATKQRNGSYVLKKSGPLNQIM